MTKNEIEKLARKYGAETCEWETVKGLFAGKDPAQNASDWANSNMMWVEFEYDGAGTKILKVTFGSSK